MATVRRTGHTIGSTHKSTTTMKISDLKKMMATLPDDAEVLIWVNIDEGKGIDYEARDPSDWHVSSSGQTPTIHIKVD